MSTAEQPAGATHPATARRHIPELALDWILEAPERRWQVLEGTLCFVDMLDLARERGGMLLKFGGDALLLFFQGPDHAPQAATATDQSVARLRNGPRMVIRNGASSANSESGPRAGDCRACVPDVSVSTTPCGAASTGAARTHHNRMSARATGNGR
jgi:hypothetical protein